jgi:hypothetical protein
MGDVSFFFVENSAVIVVVPGVAFLTSSFGTRGLALSGVWLLMKESEIL